MWLALVGAVIGSLSLGRSGVIYSVIVIIVVFLRVLISGGDKKGEGRAVFSESLILKIAAAVIGAFVGAIYEILLGSLSLKSILFSSSGILLSALFTFLFSGIFDSGISFSDFLFSKKKLFAKAKNDKERFDLYIFQGSFAAFAFLISISLRSYSFFGISPAYIYSTMLTLIISRRFGVGRGIAIGFISSFGISGIYSVCFALVGLGAGLLFSHGLAYSLVAGGGLLLFWSAYSGGMLGVLTVLPEYVSGALLASPVLHKLEGVKTTGAPSEEKNSTAEDMVFASAAAYKNAGAAGFSTLCESFRELSSSLRTLGKGEGEATYREYRDVVIESMSSFCSECHYYDACKNENPAPCAEIADLIATKVYKNERVFSEDKTLIPDYCHNAAALIDKTMRDTGKFEEEKYKSRRMNNLAELYELTSKLLLEAVEGDERERRLDAAATDKLAEVFQNNGLYDATFKVYGGRIKHIIGACEDKDGSLVTSQKLHEEISSVLGMRFGKPEYYRKGDVALFECSSVPMYSVDFATVGRCSGRETVTGDTAMSFESADGKFYSLISDGMGSGQLAHKISNFTSEYFSSMLNSLIKKGTLFHLLNHILRSKEECPTTVDLFEFDMMNGEAVFYKCGAATSYVKRDGSIFRIRSETMPVGVMKTIDAERIRVEVKVDDIVVMLSDGVSQSPEDSTWLLELLNKPAPPSVKELAERIMDGALENQKEDDDISVSVLKIGRRTGECS